MVRKLVGDDMQLSRCMCTFGVVPFGGRGEKICDKHEIISKRGAESAWGTDSDSAASLA